MTASATAQSIQPSIGSNTLMFADDDRTAPWMQDKKLGGMSPASRKASWLGEQRKRKIEKSLERNEVLSAEWQPPASAADYGLPEDGEPGFPSLQLTSRRSPKRFAPVAIDNVQINSDPPWLIKGLLPARGLVCIVGAPKSGKSFLTTDMLCAVARGVPYAGRETTAGAVLYLTGEGVSGFKRRLVRYA